jgi:hypothetical protein
MEIGRGKWDEKVELARKVGDWGLADSWQMGERDL